MQAADQLNKIMGTFYEGQNADALRAMDVAELERLLADDHEKQQVLLGELEDIYDDLIKVQSELEEVDAPDDEYLDKFTASWVVANKRIEKLL